MSIQFNCPACGKKTQAPDEMAGSKARCPICKEVIDVPQPTYGFAETEAPPAASPKTPDDRTEKSRVPCPMCGELIREGAAKCRYCGEYLDPELRKSQKQAGPDSELSAGEIAVAILCAGIGCIMGIVWMIQGKRKGLKMFLISICAAVVWNVLNIVLQIALRAR
jgi:hypothetical protein